MKKRLKIFLITIFIIISFILIDTIQALVFDNSPIIKIQTRGMMDKGILVDTYYCSNAKKDTVIKGFSYSCTNELEIIDTSKFIKDFSCAEALEEIYEDSNYIYYLSCLKSNYIEVRYEDGKIEKLREALKNSHINIKDLDKFDIDYIKYEKEKTK